MVGLSLAWELAQRGAKVAVVDRGDLGHESSWAGAGMIPPGPSRSRWSEATPLEQMAGLSNELHAQWHERFKAEVGIDNELHRCGTLRLAATPSDIELVDGPVSRWQELGIACVRLGAQEIAELEPELSAAADQYPIAFHIPSETQIRNPRHVKALVAVCQKEGVELLPETVVRELRVNSGRLAEAVTDRGVLVADQYCLAAGSWSGQLTAQLGLRLPVMPIRGQIILLAGRPGLLNHDIYVGLKYLTPRLDGRILVGSTMEDVGFHKENTAGTTADLLGFATGLAPALASLPIETCWSGLRPGTVDGKPYLGRLPNLDNAWIATGHFRAGLHLSPATAVVMAALICGETPLIDVSSLGVARCD